MFTYKSLIISLTIVATLNLGDALKCNMCDGTKDPLCNNDDNTASVTVQECSTEYDLVRDFARPRNPADTVVEYCLKVKFEGDDVYRDSVLQSCGYAGDLQDMCEIVRENKHVVFCHACQENHCN